MTQASGSCVLLADRHPGLSEGIRGLLGTTFGTVFMVTDEPSLLAGAERLQPSVVILDLALAAGDAPGLLQRIASRAPGCKTLVLSVHDEPSVAEAAREAGAHAVVLKRNIASDLLPALDELLAGRCYFPTASSGKRAMR
jgi:DNA-binding NarL/FixJ family response regulator